MTWQVVEGEVRRVLRDMAPEQFDACLSDPPYGLAFMGNRWDYSVPSANTWVELLRVLRPGAHAMLFGGTRTFHRLMVAVEDAGFLPVDTCMWMHGKGFPKSHDVSKGIDKRLGARRTKVVGYKDAGLDRGSGASVDFQGSRGRDETGLIPVMEAARWEGYGTALKPAWEPIMLAMKACGGTIAECAMRHGTGGLAIDASRVGSEVPHLAPAGNDGTSPASIAPVNVTGYAGKIVEGRWPANVVLSHADECVLRGSRLVRGTVPSGPPRTAPSDSVARGHMAGGIVNSRSAGEEELEDWECAPGCPVRILDEQGDAPSRFFYVTKASREERDRGLEGTAVTESSDTEALGDGGRGKASVHNPHPTVKPIDLCRYFARLLLPPPREDGKPRRIVVPFSGSGSEMIGCLQAGWDDVVGIELDPRHAANARLRISRGKIVQHADRRR